MGKRIYVQSSTKIQNNRRYLEGIKRHAQAILPADYTVEIEGVTGDFSSDVHYMAYEFLNNKEILSNIVEANEKGFDAVAMHCFLDPVLDEAREIVDIPVVSMAESSMLTSLMYGKKFAIVTYTPQLAKKSFPNLIAKYGLESRAIRSQYFEVSMDDLQIAFTDPEPILNQFLDACERAIEEGAEVILPGCGLLNIICVENQISKVRNTGVTILDVTGATLKMAETQIILKDVSGTSLSRGGYYESPGVLANLKL